jgi:hypothetical protein
MPAPPFDAVAIVVAGPVLPGSPLLIVAPRYPAANFVADARAVAMLAMAAAMSPASCLAGSSPHVAFAA